LIRSRRIGSASLLALDLPVVAQQDSLWNVSTKALSLASLDPSCGAGDAFS
jgi:hypothetical protein